jgi:phenylpropionate dioxygenase-like ring-hydroxylating dioxygenase large terminal subunit
MLISRTNSAIDPVLAKDWFVVAKSRDVVPGRLHPSSVLGNDLVLWRSSDGLRCWQDLCIHRGARLSIGSIDGDQVRCAYHGWCYDAAAKCVRIPAHPNLSPPARAQVKAYAVAERHGLIWMSFDPDRPQPPLVPYVDDAAFYTYASGPFRVSAAGPRMIENFLDVAHLPIVHDGYLGTTLQPEINDYVVESTPDGPVARDIRVFQPNPDGTGVAAQVSYDYGVMRPLAVYLVKHLKGALQVVMLLVTPLSETESVGYTLNSRNYPDGSTEAKREAFSHLIMGQDTVIVESQRPELLPLDLQAELHLRSDRMAVAYRQWLRGLGLAFGTS